MQSPPKERRCNITEDKFEFVHQHPVQVYQHILYLFGNRAGVEDITQSTQMAKKPTVMILGSTHLAHATFDAFNIKMDDVRTPKRQGEIEHFVTLLKAYQPTKIPLEVDEKPHGAKFQTNYQGYLNGTYKLDRSEMDQIGFRLAKQMGHTKIFGILRFMST